MLRAARPCAYCDSCDLLFGLDGLHVIEVEVGADRLSVTVESAPKVVGCGVLAVSHGRRGVVLTDAPCLGRPVHVVWRKRTWCCLEPARPVGVFTEQDEHIVRHVKVKERGPKELTGMVDLTRDEHGKTRARLLDLVPGRSGATYRDWLKERGEVFRARVKVATLDPFHGYKNAIDDQLQDAIAVVDAFDLVKLGGHAVDEVGRRVQQETLGHRGAPGDPLYGIRTILRCGVEHLSQRQHERLSQAIAADERHDEVHVAWQAGQEPRSVFHQKNPAQGRRIAEKVIASFPHLPDRGDRTPRPHPAVLVGAVPVLLRQGPRQQWWYRGGL